MGSSSKLSSSIRDVARLVNICPCCSRCIRSFISASCGVDGIVWQGHRGTGRCGRVDVAGNVEGRSGVDGLMWQGTSRDGAVLTG
eukprot:30041-Chlamydomonas_euryale.AAC.1